MLAHSSVFPVPINGIIIYPVAQTKNQEAIFDSFHSLVIHIQSNNMFC